MGKELWAASLKGKMFLCSITDSMIADELNVSRQYVNMILNGKRCPKDGQAQLEAAVEKLINKRGEKA